MSSDIQPGLRRTRSTGDLTPSRSRQSAHIRAPQRSRHSTNAPHQHGRLQPLNLTQDGSYISVPHTALLEPHSARPSAVGGMFSAPPVALQMDQAQVHHPVPYRPQRNASWFGRTLAFFGYGRAASHTRRQFVSLLWNQALGFAQIVIIIAMLAIASSKQSPTISNRTEWKACSKPLGVWCCLWIVRVVLACFLTYWGWIRDRNAHRNLSDQESSVTSQPLPGPPGYRSPAASTIPPHGRGGTRSQSGSGRHSTEITPPRSILYTRLSLLSSLLTLSWFLTAHILEYTSVNTCRHSSPHLWWLVFGILCIMYLMVLEVVLLGFIVFVVAPILFVFWNILLVCIGRHPLQNPTMIKPEIGKLPKSVVDRIPLVIYIPPPPDDFVKSPVTVPKPVYSYPPSSPSLSKPSPRPRRRFRFLPRRKKVSNTTDGGSNDDKWSSDKSQKPAVHEPQTWEDQWEPGDYPFVRLEGNRAACAICLMDFDQPKRLFELPGANTSDSSNDEVTDEITPDSPSAQPVAAVTDTSPSDVEEVHIEPATIDNDEELKLADAGDGAQPLRLLGCGHVFHKTCVDPWLIDVSGRCPVCQRPVELPEPPKGGRTGRRQS